jgi:hypothetical protein
LNLHILANVERFVTITPRQIKLNATVGSTQSVSVTVLPEKKYPFKIVSAEADKGQFIRFEIKDIKKSDRDAYLITVENTKTTKGRFFDTIKLQTDSEIRPMIDIWVFGSIK